MTETARKIEALLFLSPEPLALDVLAGLVEADREVTRAGIVEVMERHSEAGGLEIAEIAGGFALRTRADLEDVCDRLRRRPPEDRLSPAALETLAVIAYLEPVSRPDIGRLRGVSVDSTVANLVDRGLLEEAGRGASTGAMRYRTTRAFQVRFGLRDGGDLPPMERFELSGPQAEALRARLIEAGHLSEAPTGLRGVPPPSRADGE
ncbi:MAG: SMC-Scp complex subunit ScpB [Chloroflexota bacterium]|nr:SMC-Scp complex subunit ScpB [Chloroflexota bacterium]